MALSIEDIKALCAPFAHEDHEFNPRGFVYITEEAVAKRLDQVDPGWQFIIISSTSDATSYSAIGRLTVCGVERDGVGTQNIEYSSDKETGAVKTDKVGNPILAGEPLKSAATDAFKRAARLFGIGRYLLGAPKENQFRSWLTRLAKGDAPVEPPAANGWTRDQHNSLALEAQNMGIDPDELLRVLGVKKTSDYAPGFTVAREELKKYAAARPKTPTAPAVDLFAGDADVNPAQERRIR